MAISESNRSKWGATPIECCSHAAREIIDACVIPGRFELPFVKGVKYAAFCDLAGGGSDAMTIAIGHRQDDTAIIDALREIKPPCSPEAVIVEFAELLKRYGLFRVQGDRYVLSARL